MGFAVGTPVIFLKAAWADPVLYGGKGIRLGSDVDILVRGDAYAAFGGRLEAAGYRPYRVATHPISFVAGKEQEYTPPLHSLAVDLHRGLTDHPWFELGAGACIERAIDYPSVDGEVRSLAPADQVLFAAANAASHCLEVGGRPVEDMCHLLARYPVDWNEIHRQARRSGLEVPLHWLTDQLVGRGVDVPPLPVLSLRRRLGLHAATRMSRGNDPHVSKVQIVVGKRWVLSQALLSGRPTALPRYLVRYARLRALDFVARWRRR